MVSLKIFAEKTKVKIVKNIETKGSKIPQLGQYLIIIADITTPIAYTISPMIWAKAALIL
jgi:hypothetical protein